MGGADDEGGVESSSGAPGIRTSRIASRGGVSVGDATGDGGNATADARKRRRGGGGVATDSDEDMGAGVAPASVQVATKAGGKLSSKPVPSDPQALEMSQPPFSVALAAGVERLSPQERSLCEHLRLLPHQYQQIKATVVALALAKGLVRGSEATEALVHIGASFGSYVDCMWSVMVYGSIPFLFNADATKVGEVIDFCVSAGWVERAAATGSAFSGSVESS